MTFARSDAPARATARARSRRRASSASAPSDLDWIDERGTRRARDAWTARSARRTRRTARGSTPRELVRGLRDVVERLGAMIFEQHRRHADRPGTRRPARRGRDRRRATCTPTSSCERPKASRRTCRTNAARSCRSTRLMIATEPLPATSGSDVGFAHCETFADDRHLIIYGQRTSDDRIAFGGRGAPYHFGSSVEPRFDTNPQVFDEARSHAARTLPDDARLDHPRVGRAARDAARPLAVRSRRPADRDWRRPAATPATASCLSHVAATALADLITHPDADTDVHPAPLRPARGPPLGVRAASLARHQRRSRSRGWADHVEATHARVSRASRWLDRLSSLAKDVDRARRDDGDRDEGHDRFTREEHLHAERQGHRVGGGETRAVRE